ncbi:alpha/beta fold hydrolase [Microbacterium sp. NPDC076911]|uniref:alpha/beta hydrolase n=1 Tax=Microbacterium sp. NPDC076911 TaxID=3154958 RepID=UPI003413A30E
MPEFIDAHGIAIVYDVYPAATEPRAVVQLLHGVGEHAGRYHGVINDLVASGYTVYVNDHRGHGRTGVKQYDGDASKLGRLGAGGMPAALASVWQFTQLIRDENPSLPLVILGHSWGSFMAQMLINQHPEAYDALVLSGSALRTPTSLNGGDLNARWKAKGAMGTEWLSADLRVGQDFLDDPLTTSTPLLKLFGVVDAARLYGRPRKDLGYDIPALLMVGRDDSVGGPKSVHKLAAEYRERSGLTDVTTLVYPDARHEIFNDFAKGDVNADLIAWLNIRFVSRE